MKAHIALTPGLEFRSDILSNKHCLPRTTNQPIFRGIGFGSDQRKQRGAIRRRNKDEAATFTIVIIDDQAKSKLVQVES